MLGKKNM